MGSHRTRQYRHVLLCMLLSGPALLAPGCGIIRRSHQIPPVALDIAPTDTLVADTATTIEPIAQLTDSVKVVTTDPQETPRNETSRSATTSPETTLPGLVAVAPAEPDTAASALPVSAEISDAQRVRLKIESQGDLAVADSIVTVLSARQPLDDRIQEKIATIRGFITHGRDAISRDDLDAAAKLARKARLLAEEASK